MGFCIEMFGVPVGVCSFGAPRRGSLEFSAPWAPGVLGEPLDGRPVGPWAPWAASEMAPRGPLGPPLGPLGPGPRTRAQYLVQYLVQFLVQPLVQSLVQVLLQYLVQSLVPAGGRAGGRANSDPTGVHPPTQDRYPPAVGDNNCVAFFIFPPVVLPGFQESPEHSKLSVEKFGSGEP